MTESPAEAVPTTPTRNRRILVIDDEEQIGEQVSSFLTDWGSRALRLTRPDDSELRGILLPAGPDELPAFDAVAVVSRDDIVALRYALLVEHLRPGIRLIVTIFDRTSAGEIARSVPNCTVLSLTDVIVPNLLAACIDDRYRSVMSLDGRLVTADDAGRLSGLPAEAIRRRPRRALSRFAARYATLDTSARALLLSFAGLLTAFGAEAVLGVLVLHEHWYDAVWQSTRSLTTIGSSPAAEHGPAWYKLVSAAIMLAALALAGLFTASLVDRVTGRGLTAIVGRRAIPVRDHVIVVGLGQVGLRLCNTLRQLGIPVVAVERDPDARCLPLAKERRIPVVLGRGADRFLLQRAGITGARAVAAVSSDGLENISVAVTARAVAPQQRIVLRAGGAHDIMDESRSLFHIGAVCDVPQIAGALVAAHAVDAAAIGIFTSLHGQIYAAFGRDDIVRLADWNVPRADHASAVEDDVIDGAIAS